MLTPKSLIVVAICGFILWKLFANDKKHKKTASGGGEQVGANENLAASGDMVKDPMCGAFVSKDGDIRVRSGDEVHCFCSYDCRDKYVKRLQSQSAKAVPNQSADSNTAT